MGNNVLLAVFKNQLSAYEVLNNIKGNFIGKNYVITEAAVVKKENGKVVFKEGFEVSSNGEVGFLSGGLLGAFVGIIGGPLGILFGGSLGALIGESRGNAEDEIKTGILADTTKYLTDDNFGLVLLATEEENSELDEYLKKYDEEIILRKSANVVQKEVELAKEYEKELAVYDEFKKKVNKEKDKLKIKVDDVLANLKDKFEEADSKIKLEVAKLREKFRK